MKRALQENVGIRDPPPKRAVADSPDGTSTPYNPDELWRIGTVVMVKKSKVARRPILGHIIMHIRGGITKLYAIQRVRVLFDVRQGIKTYEDVDVATAAAATAALSVVVGAPRVDVRMWTSGTPCMRRNDLGHAAHVPTAADKERGFGVSDKVAKGSKGAFSGKPSQLRGLTMAEEAARKSLEATECTDDAIVRALAHLGDDWPLQDRPNVSTDGKPVKGIMLGAVFVLGGVGMAVSNVSEHFPQLTRLIATWARQSLPVGFPFSSIQINYCYAAKKHVDGNNLGPSYIRALGDHSGGALWVADKYIVEDCVDPATGLRMIRGGGGEGTLDAKGDWQLFNGNEEHYTTTFKGTRISFIVFSHHAYNKLPKPVAKTLVDLGFTAARSDHVELDYFRRFRIDKKEFDADQNTTYFAYQYKRALELPPPCAPDRLAVRPTPRNGAPLSSLSG